MKILILSLLILITAIPSYAELTAQADIKVIFDEAEIQGLQSQI